MEENVQKYRRIGYDIVINHFEEDYRNFLRDHIYMAKYGQTDWKDHIPQGIVEVLNADDKKIDNLTLNDFFEETYLWSLKEMTIQTDIYSEIDKYFGERVDKKHLIDFFDELNEFRRKIAHAKSNITEHELFSIIELFKLFCKGDQAKEFLNYLRRGEFNHEISIPEDFVVTADCIHNLPVEDYDLDGGFVGRRKEINQIKKLLFSNQDRIITITGAGGLGKTALALKTSYSIISLGNNPYKFVIWLSAKENKLTASDGIVSIESQITDYDSMILDIISILDPSLYQDFFSFEDSSDLFLEEIYNIFKSNRSLLVIDNLETISNNQIIEFIKEVPRPSQVLITSRKGLGEIERRFPLPDLEKKDAISLFRIIAKEKNRVDLQKLTAESISELVSKVRFYPLVIKWSIGKICLGVDIQNAFGKIYDGSSDISEFVFNDIFEMLSNQAKKCLFAMVLLGDKPVSKYLIQHLVGFVDDRFDDAIKELMLSSFIFSEVNEDDGKLINTYSMLTLTRGFIQKKFEDSRELKHELQAKYYELNYQIEQTEKSKLAFYDSLDAFGIKTEEDKIAFNYVKTAKNYQRSENYKDASKFYKKAYDISPNLSYVLVEYAKFEFLDGNPARCCELLDRAKATDPENFHIYHSYGVVLRKQNRLPEAIEHFKDAKKINPEFLPTYNELGRTYSFMGKYQEAQQEFEDCKALNEGITNYKHLNFTLYFQADNFRRWSEYYSLQGNEQECLRILNISRDTIRDAIKLTNNDTKNQKLERRISRDIGICFFKQRMFSEGVRELEYSASAIIDRNGKQIQDSESAALSNYYICLHGSKLRKLTKEECLERLNYARTMSTNHRTLLKIEKLIHDLDSTNLHSGYIRFFNWHKDFGVVVSEDGSEYTFIGKNFKSRDDIQYNRNVEGEIVTFEVVTHRQMQKKIAQSVQLSN